MRFTGELTVNAPRDVVFDKLKDAPFFASCVEGVHELKEIAPNRYTALFETRIAYMRFKFEVAVEMTRAERPVAIAARIEGKPIGIVGRLSATSAAEFAESAAGTTITYAVEASLTGKLGSIGQPVLKSKAKEMQRQFVANLRQAFHTDVQEAAT